MEGHNKLIDILTNSLMTSTFMAFPPHHATSNSTLMLTQVTWGGGGGGPGGNKGAVPASRQEGLKYICRNSLK